jgi:hypothetical protein
MYLAVNMYVSERNSRTRSHLLGFCSEQLGERCLAGAYRAGYQYSNAVSLLAIDVSREEGSKKVELFFSMGQPRWDVLRREFFLILEDPQFNKTSSKVDN